MIKSAASCLLLSLVLWVSAVDAQETDQNYEKAVTAQQAGKYKEAFIHLKNALQADPDNLPARLLLALVHFNEGDIYSAEKESEQALLLGADINLVLPVYGTSLVLQSKVDKLFEIQQVYNTFTPASRFEWALLKGQGYLIKRESALAQAEFEKAAAMFPDDVRAKNTLASIYLGEGMLPQAQSMIDESLALEPGNAKTLVLRGELALSQADYGQALKSFSKAHDLAPEDLRVLRSLAQVNLLLGNYAEMQKYLDLILEQSPEDPAATLLSAILQMNQGEVALGEEMLANLSDKLSLLDKAKIKSADTFLFIRASADYLRGNDESAISLLNAYSSRNKGDLAAIRMLADLYLRNGEDTQATQLLSDSKAYVVADFGLTLQLLRLYIQSNNNFGAQELLEDIKETAPDNPYVRMLEAEFLRSRGQAASALALLDGRDYGDAEPTEYGLLRGALQLDLGMEQVAQTTARRLLDLYPNNVRAQNFSAITYLRAGKLDDAETNINLALALDPANVQARFNQAMLAKERDQFEQASKLLNAILEDQPNHANSILLIARILFEQGNFQEAIDWSKKVYAYQPEASAPGELQLEIYSQLAEWNNALPVALQLAKRNPLNGNYLVRLANVYMELRDNESAQRALYKLYTLWEDDPTKLRDLAALQVRSHNLKAARKSLETAQQLDTSSFETKLALARLYLAEGQPEDTAEAARNMESEFGERTELSYLQGEAALAREDLAAAQAHFTKSFELEKENIAAVIRLYQLSIKGVGGTEFTSLLESILKESSLPPWAVRLLADSYLAQENTVAATKYYERLLELPEFAKDPGILNNLANIYAAEDLEKALATAKEGLQEKGKNSSALLDTIGWILAQQNLHEQALPYFREAYAINSSDPEIRYHTGVTLLALGRKNEAEKELRAALSLRESFAGRDEALILLGIEK